MSENNGEKKYAFMRIEWLTADEMQRQINHDIRVNTRDYIDHEKSGENLVYLPDNQRVGRIEDAKAEFKDILSRIKDDNRLTFDQRREANKIWHQATSTEIWEGKDRYKTASTFFRGAGDCFGAIADQLERDNPVLAVGFMVLDLLCQLLTIACQEAHKASIENRQIQSQAAFDELKKQNDKAYIEFRERSKDAYQRAIAETKQNKNKKGNVFTKKELEELMKNKNIHLPNGKKHEYKIMKGYERKNKNKGTNSKWRGKNVAISSGFFFSPKPAGEKWTADEIQQIWDTGLKTVLQMGDDLNTEILYATLHLDEKTPHIQFMMSAYDRNYKSLNGVLNPKKLEEYQTLIADKFADMGFSRGEKGSKRKHYGTGEAKRKETLALQKQAETAVEIKKQAETQVETLNSEISGKNKLIDQQKTELDKVNAEKAQAEKAKELAKAESKKIFDDLLDKIIDSREAEFLAKELERKTGIKQDRDQEREARQAKDGSAELLRKLGLASGLTPAEIKEKQRQKEAEEAAYEEEKTNGFFRFDR